MKIVIHGTNGGYKIITPEQVPGLFDARPDSSKVAAIGKQAYSLHFNGDGVVFSKYRIVRDVIGDLRTGNIAFSVAVPNTEKLAGKDIQALLDEAALEFAGKYIKDNNLGNVRNDWGFIAGIENRYEPKLKKQPGAGSIPQGAGEAAFAYYTGDEELQKYFDMPRHRMYQRYKQVFFVEKGLKDKPENPLNALKHSEDDLTGKIIFELPPDQPAVMEDVERLKAQMEAKRITGANNTAPSGSHGKAGAGPAAVVFSPAGKRRKALSSIFELIYRYKKAIIIAFVASTALAVLLVMVMHGAKMSAMRAAEVRADSIRVMITEYLKGDTAILLDQLEKYKIEWETETPGKYREEWSDISLRIKKAIDEKKLVDSAGVDDKNIVMDIDSVRQPDSIGKNSANVVPQKSAGEEGAGKSAAKQTAGAGAGTGVKAPATGSDIEIRTALKSKPLEKAELQEYLKKTQDSKLKDGINLYLEFWDLTSASLEGYEQLAKRVHKNINLQGSPLDKFLEKETKKPKSGYNYSRTYKIDGLKGQ
ncbi:MAG: hypothetical protein FWB85_00900 [Chitinispirillia bacterium]|nr:hypothetical protein [Chitinispirillia bacterium]MCL2241060.1 hypothetical protein [Chitinispirillia bacterium]